MKICVGIKSYEDLEKYIQAGAEEFYCGVIDENWICKYGYINAINRRPWPNSNLYGFDELKQVVKKAHKHNCKVFYTINEHCYTNIQIEDLKRNISNAVNSGIDAIIFSDIGLMKYFKEKYDCEIHVSTGGTVFNLNTVKFYHEELGAKRIILPRSVTIDEISRISSGAEGVELEVFALNEGCLNIDGFCNHIHGLIYLSDKGKNIQNEYSSGCLLKYDVVDIQDKDSCDFSKEELKNKLFESVLNAGNCGICALYYFKKFEVNSLKLVGRASPKGKIENDIRLLKAAIELSEREENFEKFYREMSSLVCKNNEKDDNHKCYYPDILRGLRNV